MCQSAGVPCWYHIHKLLVAKTIWILSGPHCTFVFPSTHPCLPTFCFPSQLVFQKQLNRQVLLSGLSNNCKWLHKLPYGTDTWLANIKWFSHWPEFGLARSPFSCMSWCLESQGHIFSEGCRCRFLGMKMVKPQLVTSHEVQTGVPEEKQLEKTYSESVKPLYTL